MHSSNASSSEKEPGIVPYAELAPLGPRTLTALFDLSNKCNLRCRMCYFSYDSVFHRPSVYMTPDTFERIASTLLPMAHTVYLSAGSESLTSPHFLDILRIASRYSPPELKLLTNGLLLTPEIDDALIAHGLTQIHFSVDGATKSTYEHVRRGGRFDDLVRNVRELAERKAAAGKATPILQFNVTLMRSNLDELDRFVDLAVDLGVEQIACRHLMPYEGLDMEGELTSLDPRRANERFHAMLEHATRAGVRITSFPDFYSVDGAPWTPPLEIDAAGAHARRETALARSADSVERELDRDAPFGRIDQPAHGVSEATGSIEIAGWALDLGGIDRVEIRRERVDADAPSLIDADGSVHVGFATLRNGARPDVAAVYPDVRSSYRAGWTFELARSALPEGGDGTVRVHAIAHAASGAVKDLGLRAIEFREGRRAPPFLFCRKPFDNVYIDSAANVYPYPDCQTVDPFGSLARESSFREIWFGDEFNALRKRIAERDTPRMCLTCPDFINRRVDDPVFFRERRVETDFLKPIGFLDHPRAHHESSLPVVELRGWALSFARIDRVEIRREPVEADERRRVENDGLVLVGRATLGASARADVAARHRRYPDVDRAGWTFDLRRAELRGPGPFVLIAVAFGTDGQSTRLGSTSVRFVRRERDEPAGITGNIDRPAARFTALSACIDLIGWAVSTEGRPRVFVRRKAVDADPRSLVGIDGLVDLGDCRPHRKRRPDLRARYPHVAGAARSGWRKRIRRSDLPCDGPHEIHVFASSASGEARELGVRFVRFEDSALARSEGSSARVEHFAVAHTESREVARLDAATRDGEPGARAP